MAAKIEDALDLRKPQATPPAEKPEPTQEKPPEKNWHDMTRDEQNELDQRLRQQTLFA